MGKFAERVRRFDEKLGRIDDESLIRPEDPDSGTKGLKAWLSGMPLFFGLQALGRTFASDDVVFAVMGAGTLTFLVGYVVWRRRRNKRLTGSPTEWPS